MNAAQYSAAWFRGLTLVMAAALLGLALRPDGHVFDMPMTEDGYYALAVARNVAAGAGITIDGIHLTNGFQPLFTFIEAIAFLLTDGDDEGALRLVMAFAYLFHVGGALLVGLLARDAWPSRFGAIERDTRTALGTLLYLASPLMLNHAYNGLETGCVIFFYAAIARWLQTGRDATWWGLAVYGALIGLLVLARIDAAFIAVVLGLNELRRSWPRGVAFAFQRGVVLGGVALLISSPWWIYNTVYFGSPMPTSGTAQQDWALEWMRIEHAEWALRMVLAPWIFAGAHEAAVSIDVPIPAEPGYMTFTAIGLVRTLVLIGGVVLLLRFGRTTDTDPDPSPTEEERRARTLEFARCLALGFAALIAYYTLSFVAYWFYYRYFAPLALFAFVAAPVVLARLLVEQHARTAIMAVVGALTLQAAILTSFAWYGEGLGGNTVYHDQVALAREFVPEGDAVAAGQSGTLGFFRARVVNTDGKVNRDALAYQDHMWDYLRERNVRWFVDWPFYVNKYLGVPLGADDRPAVAANGWRLVAEREYFYLYEYTGP